MKRPIKDIIINCHDSGGPSGKKSTTDEDLLRQIQEELKEEILYFCHLFVSCNESAHGEITRGIIMTLKGLNALKEFGTNILKVDINNERLLKMRSFLLMNEDKVNALKKRLKDKESKRIHEILDFPEENNV